jgi:2Fe-2S ferredoxin
VPRIHVDNDDVVFEVARGGSLMEAIELYPTSIMFGCRNAGCGVCKIRVKDGFDNLNKPTYEEAQLLTALGADADHRLCCQVKVYGDAVIEVIGAFRE